MSCMLKIKESMSSFTKTERLIGEYILSHKDEFIHESAQSLGEKIGTSAAAIVRFSKMMGYRGLPAMKMDLASISDKEIPEDLTEALDESDSLEILSRKTYQNYLSNLVKTYDLIDFKQLEQATQLIKNARRVFLFGIGGSGIVCMDLYHKLTRIGCDVIYNNDTHVQLASAAHMTVQDVCIGISYSGESGEVVVPFQLAKEKGVATVGITRLNKNSLSKLSDCIFHIPFQEKALRVGAIASRNATLLITDLLYLAVAEIEFANTKIDLEKTREMIQRLKEY